MARAGLTAMGKPRWLCRDCARTFVRRALPGRRCRQRVWFERWVREGYSLRQLHQQSGVPQRTLRRIIHYWLDRLPHAQADLSGYRHVLIDCTYLRNRRPAVTVVMDAVTNTVIAGAYDLHEASPGMAPFCAVLAQRGLNPASITTDGHRALLRRLRTQWPEVILQRCLVHIQRQGLAWCRQRPTRTDAQHLRLLFRQVTAVHTREARDRWVDQLIAWEQRYGWKIALMPERGYVFSDLKRARSSLVHALSDMFHYLDHPGIAPTTNGLEGYFSRFKNHYRQHRGLNPQHRRAYIQWFLNLCPR